MGDDFAHLLASYGVSMSGSADVDHMSIGGPPCWFGKDLPVTEELLREPLGISGTHNFFEVDGSLTRGDLYEK